MRARRNPLKYPELSTGTWKHKIKHEMKLSKYGSCVVKEFGKCMASRGDQIVSDQ